MTETSQDLKSQVVKSAWYRDLARFEKPDVRKAVGQIANTFIPYIGLWAAMIWMAKHNVSWLLIAPLMIVTGGLVVRLFIMQHDCGHGSFLNSRSANKILGSICSLLTFTPYEDWKHEHAAHHAGAQNLERRGIGDIPTMTVQEYEAAPRIKQIAYRLYRNPFVIFCIGPTALFVIGHRFAHKRSGPAERKSVLFTNVGLLAIFTLAHFTIGLGTFLMLQMPIIIMAASIGVWLFYVQHQYEDVYWSHQENWDPISAALEGSSYFKLPKVLQWFSGNIGYHHIHHLKPRIPNLQSSESVRGVP